MEDKKYYVEAAGDHWDVQAFIGESLDEVEWVATVETEHLARVLVWALENSATMYQLMED